ncbi:hypothetical protein [Comamonas jiangduensis]|uniref:hypothetical protein n=1 Tax=Comamonas jiangduensis TaxID=1194168 RepID=UPI0015821A9A|nr:hypothetical protein [Comamonas jiangduensis]
MLMTANPCADAERWENEQDLRAAQAEALEIKAYGIALEALSSKQASWYKAHHVGDTMLTPDEVMVDAIGNDDDVTDAFDALMTDPAPAAQKLREALASYMAKHFWPSIAGYPDAV